MADKRYDAIIIGAGHNGLICANYLARAVFLCWFWIDCLGPAEG